MNLDFQLTEEQEMLKRTVRSFVEKEGTKERIHEALRTKKHSKAVWEKMADMGLLGLSIPFEYGGSGGDLLDLVLVLEELSPIDPLVGPFFPSVCFGGKSIGLMGTEEQKEEYLPRIASGNLLFALSITEPNGGTDVLGAMKTHAELEGDEWVINGAKAFTSFAQDADYMIVVARTKKREEVKKLTDGVSVFIVPSNTPGITINEIDVIVPLGDTNMVFYDDVRIPKENLLGDLDKGFYQILNILNVERIMGAAVGVGLAKAAYNQSVKYAKERHAFGKPIGQFQAIQHYLADMVTGIELARLLTYKAAWLQTQGKPYAVEATMAKMYSGEMAVKTCDNAIQIHGGMGLTNMESDVSRYWRYARLLKIAPISNEQAKNTIAEMKMGLPRSY